MHIKIFNKEIGSVYTKDNIHFTLNFDEIYLKFPKFHFFYHRKTKDGLYKEPIFQLIIGYNSMYTYKTNKGLIYINNAYDSRKYIFGIPIQRFLNKSYLKCEAKEAIEGETEEIEN